MKHTFGRSGCICIILAYISYLVTIFTSKTTIPLPLSVQQFYYTLSNICIAYPNVSVAYLGVSVLDLKVCSMHLWIWAYLGESVTGLHVSVVYCTNESNINQKHLACFIQFINSAEMFIFYCPLCVFSCLWLMLQSSSLFLSSVAGWCFFLSCLFCGSHFIFYSTYFFCFVMAEAGWVGRGRSHLY